MNELETAIYSRLAGGTALTTSLGGTAIYNTTAPQGAAYPLVLFSLISEVDQYALSAQTATDFIYQVKAITRSPGGSPSRKKAGEIDALVKARLNDAALSVTGHSTLSIRRQTGFAFDEVDAATGNIYSHAGGNYRVWIA